MTLTVRDGRQPGRRFRRGVEAARGGDRGVLCAGRAAAGHGLVERRVQRCDGEVGGERDASLGRQTLQIRARVSKRGLSLSITLSLSLSHSLSLSLTLSLQGE